MRTTSIPALLPTLLPVILAAVLASGAAAQTRSPPPRPASATPAAPAGGSTASTGAVPSTPQQTTASFMDWTLRCSRLGPPPGTQFCEVAQGIQREDKPVAQLAVGRAAKGQPMQLTILVPVNVSFAAAPSLSGPPGAAEGPALDLTWRRCLPGGCVADVPLSDEAVLRMRGWAEPGRITFQDALGRAGALPFSPRGLAPALDALAKEEGG